MFLSNSTLRPLLLPLLLFFSLPSLNSACTRLHLTWKTYPLPEQHLSGSLWDDGTRICTVDTALDLPSDTDLWGYPMDCIGGFRAQVARDLKHVSYWPRRKLWAERMFFDARWSVNGTEAWTQWELRKDKVGMEDLPEEVVVWASVYGCWTCVGPRCKCRENHRLPSSVDLEIQVVIGGDANGKAGKMDAA
jgi:hypothetical protein